MVLKIIAFELVAGVSVNYEKNTFDRPSTCQEKCPEISEPTKRHVTQLNWFHINETLT